MFFGSTGSVAIRRCRGSLGAAVTAFECVQVAQVALEGPNYMQPWRDVLKFMQDLRTRFLNGLSVLHHFSHYWWLITSLL